MASGVVDKTDHGQGDGHLLIGGTELSSVAFGFVTIKEYATHDGPYHGGVGTALTGAIDGITLTVGVEFVGHA